MSIPDLESTNEQLTAYLDGELSATEAAALEYQLVNNESLRLRLAELRRAYDLLDELPETPHNQRFTKSTLELVVKDLTSSQTFAKQSVDPSAVLADWWGWPRILFMAVAVLGTGAITGLAIRAWRIQNDMSDLGLIASIQGMKHIHDIGVAIKLSQEQEALAVLRKQNEERLIPPIPDSTWKRKAWVNSLPPMQIAKLDMGRETLRKLDSKTRFHFADMVSQIEGSPDSKALQETIRIVGLVMDRLPRSKRDDLEGLNTEQRTAFIRDQIYVAAAMSYAANLSTEDAKALEEWDEQSFRPALAQELQPTRVMETRDLLNTLLFRRRLESGAQLDNQSELVELLMQKLSKTGKTLLSGVNRADQLRVLYAWLLPERINSTQVLIDAYEKNVRSEYRDRIDIADPDQSRRTLEEVTNRPNNRGRNRPQ